MDINIIVHTFSLGDVDDPEIYAAQPLWEWQQTEAGKWVMEHAVETPSWSRHLDHMSYSLQFKVVAKLKESDATFFKLKYQL